MLFRSFRILIATDIIARGLDISEVTHVINFDIPEVPENYIHRIGRTGRANKNGIAITFIRPIDLENLTKIENLMKIKISIAKFPSEVFISKVLTEEEKPKIPMKSLESKIRLKENFGGSFHEKSEKNKKVNIRIRHVEKMREKYGKPLTRGEKKK